MSGDASGAQKSTMKQLLTEMVERGASDLLLNLGKPPQFRIHGRLQAFSEALLTPEQTQDLAYSLLDGAMQAELEEVRSLDFSQQIDGLARFRFNIFYQQGCVALVARVIPLGVPKWDDLGIPAIVRDFALLPHGLVLVTGPAGSGKSTTLASMIDYINDHKHLHIVCIEDPIEYVHTQRNCTIVQREIGSDARTFKEALRSVFRQSPDVIMIGEMRDLETVELALTLSETGHLILGTLHTQDATHSINRIVDMFPSNQQEQVYMQLSLVLQGVVSQQLMISTGEDRRYLACEILKMTPAVQNLIREMEIQQVYSVIQAGRGEGMLTMNDSLLHLWRMGLIQESLALARSPRPKELIRLMQRATNIS